jgi:hypothetical protein
MVGWLRIMAFSGQIRHRVGNIGTEETRLQPGNQAHITRTG